MGCQNRTNHTPEQTIDLSCLKNFTFFYSLTCVVTQQTDICRKFNNMKKLILPLMLIANSLYGQTLTYEQTQDITVTSNYSNGDTLSSYIMKDGSEIKVGTKLKF